MNEIGDRSRKGLEIREIAETLVLTLVTYFLIRTLVFETYRVVGQSMMPTLEEDQRLIVSKLSYRLHEPQRGDIIVFLDPFDSDRNLIKRIIGLPGDLLEIRQGRVYVDGQLLAEPYISRLAPSSQSPTVIPEGQYFVMGDNRPNSSDSRSWGMLDSAEIVGKAAFTYWPLKLWGSVPHQVYSEQP